ncbi:unnamed protein product [Allacma fusca]|uniref:Uncharacterized protein n=1 Tax=Allacma fusca TaxID=39272 RepID=A0A8J2P0M6_9HEXA|nr:unnamed protein product [Allacma fusca]
MAAQYAAELASTMTLTPSSTSACSTSSESSNLSNCSSTSGTTPADAHYQHVLTQLRELWLEERMKLYPLPSSQCTCGDNVSGRGMGFKSSTASTPAATTPNGQPECIMTLIHNSSFAAPRSVPCLASHKNNKGNLNQASPENSSHQTPHHQYLQHVIISNQFGQSPGHSSKSSHSNGVKQNYIPGIYLVIFVFLANLCAHFHPFLIKLSFHLIKYFV